VTENVKLVDVVPDPGETDGPVRLPLSGQLTARTGAGTASSDALINAVSAIAPTSVILDRCRAGRVKADSVSWVDHIRVLARGQ
jgi:hypothetical protein